MFFHESNGYVRPIINFKYLIGLDQNKYKRSSDLTEELEDKIRNRLQEIWNENKEELLKMMVQKNIRRIHELFGIPEMKNGLDTLEWYEKYQKGQKRAQYNNNLLEWQYKLERSVSMEEDDKKFQNYFFSAENEFGKLREYRLEKEAKVRRRRSFSESEKGSKMDEYPFFLEKITGIKYKFELPDFQKNHWKRERILMDKKKRS